MLNFVFGYAGIPNEVYDSIIKMGQTLSGDKNTEVFFAAPLKQTSPIINSSHINFLCNKFKAITLDEISENKGDSGFVSAVGFAVIYVRSAQDNHDLFADAFFPSTLVLSVDWNLSGCNSKEINKSKNELFQLLLQATMRARMAIKMLHNEVTERRNRTPLLLPVKNFRSATLRNRLQSLQLNLAMAQTEAAITENIQKIVDLLKNDHPLKRIDNTKMPCFLDDRKIEFHSPGSALHGLHRSSEEHPVGCLLGSYRRLGAPFHAAFHYDCKKGMRGNLKDLFCSCHEESESTFEGKPHLNIAPNDFVRT